jgi:hypothetical protein
VSPRSEERKSRVPATSAHTTFADGALSCAVVGSGIGLDEANAVGVGVAVVATAVGDGEGDWDGAAVCGLEHAARSKTTRRLMRIVIGSQVYTKHRVLGRSVRCDR